MNAFVFFLFVYGFFYQQGDEASEFGYLNGNRLNVYAVDAIFYDV